MRTEAHLDPTPLQGSLADTECYYETLVRRSKKTKTTTFLTAKDLLAACHVSSYPCFLCSCRDL